MQWKDICKEVAVSYKHRSWILVRTPKSVADCVGLPVESGPPWITGFHHD
jgi:hypothetical protein